MDIDGHIVSDVTMRCVKVYNSLHRTWREYHPKQIQQSFINPQTIHLFHHNEHHFDSLGMVLYVQSAWAIPAVFNNLKRRFLKLT